MSPKQKQAAEGGKEKAIRRLLLRPDKLFAFRWERRWLLLDEGVACWPWPSWWEKPTRERTDVVVPLRLGPDARPLPRVADAVMLDKCEKVWKEAFKALKVSTRLKTTGETWEHKEKGLLAERFVRDEDEEPVLLAQQFAKTMRALARSAEEPRLVQVAGRGISFFDPLHQPVALLDGKRMIAMAMPIKETDE